MPEPRFLFDSKAQWHYLGFGGYRKLLPYLTFKSGTARRLDRLALSLQSCLPFLSRQIDIQTKMLWDKLVHLYGNSMNAALLYNTSWYKDTTYIGIIDTPQGRNFVKVYPKQEDLIFQLHQAKFIQEHFSGPFTTIPVLRAQDSFLVSPHIPRKRSIDKDDHIDSNIIHLSNRLRNATQVFKPARDIIPIDIGVIFMKAGDPVLYRRIRSWALEQHQPLPIIPVHGDMTPWNLYVSLEEKIVLTDYERAGWHVPFYDYFHFVLQPLARQDEAPALDKIVFDLEFDQARQALILYLIDQLYHDMVSHFDKGHTHRYMHNLIKNKRQWLMQALNVA